MACPGNSPDLNPIEILWWKFKKVYEKTPFIKEYLLSDIRESLNYFDKKYCFKLVKGIN